MQFIITGMIGKSGQYGKLLMGNFVILTVKKYIKEVYHTGEKFGQTWGEILTCLQEEKKKKKSGPGLYITL